MDVMSFTCEAMNTSIDANLPKTFNAHRASNNFFGVRDTILSNVTLVVARGQAGTNVETSSGSTRLLR